MKVEHQFIATCIDAQPLPTIFLQGWFPFAGCSKRPLSDHFEIQEEQRYEETQHPANPTDHDEDHDGCENAHQTHEYGQNMVSSAGPIQHVNDSRCAVSLLGWLPLLQRLLQRPRRSLILFWPCVLLGASPTDRQSCPCSQVEPKCQRLSPLQRGYISPSTL